MNTNKNLKVEETFNLAIKNHQHGQSSHRRTRTDGPQEDRAISTPRNVEREMLNAIVKEIQGLLDLQTFSRNHFPEVIGHLTLELCSRSNTAQMVPSTN